MRIIEKRKQFHIRLTDEEYEILQKKVNKSGLSQQSYIFHCLMSKPIKIVDFSKFNQVAESINKIEWLLKDYAKKVDIEDKEIVDLYLESLKRIDEIWHLLKESL